MKVTILHDKVTILQLEAGDSTTLNERLNLLADAVRAAINGRFRDYPGSVGAQRIHLKLGREIVWRGIRPVDLDSAIRRLIDWQS